MRVRMFFARMGCMRPATAGELCASQMSVGPPLILLLTWWLQIALLCAALRLLQVCLLLCGSLPAELEHIALCLRLLAAAGSLPAGLEKQLSTSD